MDIVIIGSSITYFSSRTKNTFPIYELHIQPVIIICIRNIEFYAMLLNAM